jgi:lipopolysaccharide heptosyltransferase II
MNKILLIQTAFLGDVILATPLLRELKIRYPDTQLDILVRKGNETLLQNNPHVSQLLVWDKQKGKYKELLKLLRSIRTEKYDEVITIQRFFNAGFLTAFSGAKSRVGFANNPLSFLFTKKIKHIFGDGTHEVERNFSLIKHHIHDNYSLRPELFPLAHDFDKVAKFKHAPYYCIAPSSVWFTKQMSSDKWLELIHSLDANATIYLLGGKGDRDSIEQICQASKRTSIFNVAGELSLLESAALMKDAKRCYVNDSGPLHISSAVNAPVSAFFCSTVPEFGFGPLSDDSEIVQTKHKLDCRPCGMHGHKTCPQQHFACNKQIDVGEVKR